MKKDLRERFGQFFDDELMTMSRHFMGEDEKRPFGNRDNMFDMLYGFDVKEMKYFLWIDHQDVSGNWFHSTLLRMFSNFPLIDQFWWYLCNGVWGMIRMGCWDIRLI